MNSISRLLVRRALPGVAHLDRLWFAPLISALLTLVVLFMTLTSSAQTPTPPAGGLPSASRLQQVHDLGQRISDSTFRTETTPVPFRPSVPPTKDLMRYRLDDYLKEHGSQWSDAEKDVFTEAYWREFDKNYDSFGSGMTQIDPPSLQLPGASPSTTVSGKTKTPGPGTLQLTDEKGNTYFVDVDANGNYSRTVPQSNFQPVKMTLRTGTTKTAWVLDKQGKWTQIASTAGAAPTQNALQQFALVDECKQYVLVGSLNQEPLSPMIRERQSSRAPLLLAVRFAGGQGPIHSNETRPFAWLVDDPLPPDVVREAQKQGIDHADQEFEKSQLEKIKNRTPEQQRRLDDLDSKLKDYDKWKSNPFSNQETIKIAEDAAKARWLQRQAEALRASGAPGAEQAAQNLLNQAQQLLGGQTLPRLRASAQEPLQFSSASTPAGSNTRIVAPGQSGYALLGSPSTTVGSPATIKGHSRLVATGDIKKQTTTELALEPLAHLEEEPSATSSFAQYFGYDLTSRSWGKPNVSLAAEWEALDAKPSNITAIGSTGGFGFNDWNISGKTCYKLNVSYGYDHVSTAISPRDATRTFELTINANPYWIAGFKSGVDINRFQTDYMKVGQVDGAQYTWTHWHTPFQDTPMISSGQISDEGYNRLSWDSPYKDVMAYGELNPGTSPLPVFGLDPADWPNAEADPLPRMVLTDAWLKE